LYHRIVRNPQNAPFVKMEHWKQVNSLAMISLTTLRTWYHPSPILPRRLRWKLCYFRKLQNYTHFVVWNVISNKKKVPTSNGPILLFSYHLSVSNEDSTFFSSSFSIFISMLDMGVWQYCWFPTLFKFIYHARISYLGKIVLLSIWFRIVSHQIITHTYKDHITLTYLPIMNAYDYYYNFGTYM
jgi:hypothetical protein